MSDILAFDILGVPAPAGSKRGFVVNGRAVLVNDNKSTQKAWRQAVSNAAHEARLAQQVGPFRGGVVLIIKFVLPRPKSARKTDVWKTTKPDLDKLLRSTLDGLTDAAVFTDDALVVSLSASKRLADVDGTESPGAHVMVMEATVPVQDPLKVPKLTPAQRQRMHDLAAQTPVWKGEVS